MKNLIFFLCPNQMNQVSIYREIFFMNFGNFFFLKKINLQRNNWGPMFKMIRIRSTNQNVTRVPLYPEFGFSLHPCSLTRLCPRVCCTCRFWPTETRHVSLCGQIKHVELIYPLSLPLPHSTHPLELFHLLKGTFNMVFQHHWTWSNKSLLFEKYISFLTTLRES